MTTAVVTTAVVVTAVVVTAVVVTAVVVTAVAGGRPPSDLSWLFDATSRTCRAYFP